MVALLSALTWILYGNGHYAGPIKSITVYTIGREIELPKTGYGHSSHKYATPGSAKPAAAAAAIALTPSKGGDGHGMTTSMGVGKTANLYSASLLTSDWTERQNETRSAAFTPSHGATTDASSQWTEGSYTSGSEGSEESSDEDDEGGGAYTGHRRDPEEPRRQQQQVSQPPLRGQIPFAPSSTVRPPPQATRPGPTMRVPPPTIRAADPQ